MARRAKGEGTIYRLPNGSWRARIRYRGKEHTVTSRTKTGAAKKLATLKTKLGLDTDPITVTELVELWLESGNWSPATQEAYTRRTTNLITPIYGHYLITELTPKIIEAGYQQLAAKGSTTRTIKTAHDTLATLINKAIRLGMIHTSPMPRVETPKPETRAPDPMTLEEARHFLATAKQANDKYLPAWGLMLLMGLRSGEARAITWEDITDNNLHIHRSITKTKAGARTIPIPKPMQDILNQTPQPQRTGLIVTTRDGKPVSDPTFALAWQRAITRAQIRYRRIHDCRHTCGSLLAAHGIPTRVIQDILGHATPTMSIHYTRQTGEAQTKAMNTMAEAFGPITQ